MAANVNAEEELRLLEEASRVLPADVLELVKAKPPQERLVLLRALVQVRACEARCHYGSAGAQARRVARVRFGMAPPRCM
jgi:hypothetical protein